MSKRPMNTTRMCGGNQQLISQSMFLMVFDSALIEAQHPEPEQEDNDRHINEGRGRPIEELGRWNDSTRFFAAVSQ